MTVSWDIGNVKDYKEVWPVWEEGEPQERIAEAVKTDALLHLMIERLGMTEITEANVDEVFIRVRMWEKATYPTFTLNHEEQLFKREDIERRVGLRCDTYSRKSIKQFNEYLGRWVRGAYDSKALTRR